ncbi:MAG: fumarylacetoacetate hydrolase family protein [Candidatus Omnitrophota bacterium]|nr:fumarylacetoacetate hydrolase family protein [Candidatus Omnitrophota bacterium]
MKIVRFSREKLILWGVVEDNYIEVLKHDPFQTIQKTSQKIPLNKVKILAPTVPSKIICVGLNYKDHVAELSMAIPSEPIIFLKPTTSVISHNDKIIYPGNVDRVDYEAELAVVIKKKAKSVSVRDVNKYILGYTCLNDVTARNIQVKDIQWSRAKSFDTFCPIGPWIETTVKNINKLQIKSYLNGKIKQHSNTSEFIFSVEKIVSFISNIMTLLPGDIISTGTPSGVGPMKIGDTIEIEIENIGRLTNSVQLVGIKY